ncbi:MAG: cbb3-type cytochrome oxidase assembly protein CcoS [Planctomycetota bacterium]|nr:MAG: cbb3-type cytochrome oxidase assembly protein CcoS [Planctomycetota bacterium]REJ96490.1 MAG: cbb3-type cytochrome oxidase assembly protein CcoS [Planctomycetota bacterium]REK25134.1 MAG: cbb3-type cytochrome oxidase assembly protein CcoS [Planctomycetota bacterium]REK40526.1 MAG: cbb3-type cytochrome oxidase assembly protein CcoS [Planctomycetota bacterium]
MAASSARAARWRSTITLLLAVLILVPSCAGFVQKLFKFFVVTQGETASAFAVAPLVNYLLASFGFLLLLFWAATNGMFHDIEEPKHTMLENERLLDRLSDE